MQSDIKETIKTHRQASNDNIEMHDNHREPQNAHTKQISIDLKKWKDSKWDINKRNKTLNTLSN